LIFSRDGCSWERRGRSGRFLSIFSSISVFVAQSRGSKEKTQTWPLSTLPAKYPASAFFPEYQWAKSKEGRKLERQRL